MTKLFGESVNHLLFTDGDNAVIIDKHTNMVDDIGPIALLSSAQVWRNDDISAEQSFYDLAAGALADLRVKVIVASGRMYTIPKTVQEEAKKALEWRKEHHRGGTPVGLNTARILANGGQIGLQKVRHIAKYFPRHEVDKKGKGWKPGDDSFPSNGRIAWALWGGDAGWRWARAIVERENKNALRASGYTSVENDDLDDSYLTSFDYDADIDAFSAAFSDDENGPEFVARVRLDESGIDRLYLVNDGTVSVWDGGDWDTLGLNEGDIAAYDRLLDDEPDETEFSHVLIDADSAMVLSAHLQQNPFKPVSIDDLDPEEASLVAAAADEIDWSLVDMVITAAGEDPLSSTDSKATDGNYTPEERSKKARGQVRDKGGKFAAMGSRVVVGGDASKSGNITGINPATQSVRVKMDDGSEIDVPANTTQKAEDFTAPTMVTPKDATPVDVSGILGQPRAPIDRPNAKLPNGLPALTSQELGKVISDFPAWVKSQRDQQQAPSSKDTIKTKTKEQVQADTAAKAKQIKKESGVNFDEKLGDIRQHPLFKNLFKTKPSLNLYYTPPGTIAAGTPATKEEPLTPETSDVRPVYMAIVSPEDPRAVFDLISLVPASATSTSPIVYKRADGKWVKDDQILADLTSATPPPVVPLQGEALMDTLQQIDKTVVASVDPLLADVGDKVGNKIKGHITGAERLRRYWTHGKGAAKIRWGTPGDWSRCVRHLGKYMGPRAKGYCNLRHHDALHIWPATHAKILRGGRNRKHFAVDEFIMEEPVYGFDFEEMAKHKPKTVVTAEDLARDIDDIYKDHDELYDHKWEPDEDIVSIIKYLDYDYESGKPLFAAGGLDKNRGNAEKLRHYWLFGRGAVKIRWNTPGDWTRCYRHLSKYMGLRAKGYCSLRHKEATGVWPGSKYNIGKKNIRASAFYPGDLPSEESVLELVRMQAAINDARERVILASTGVSEGAAFRIPLVIPEKVESGDGRKFRAGSLEFRELPLPLLWQIKTASGHDGSVVVGRIDHMERTDDGIGNAYGVFDTGAYGREAERMVREGFIRGVSADLDRFEASEESDSDDEAAKKDDKKIGGGKINIDKARVMAVTIVPKPAFEECRIYLEQNTDAGESQEEDMEQMPDGIYVEDMDETEASAIVACGMVAGSIPTTPPATWFANPELSGPTPLTVDDHGRVFGHIAAWHVNHIGMSYGTRPPRSKSKYAYFHTGVVRADDGKDYPVGQLTLAGGHASLEASAVDAARHYDDTGSAIADVTAGEDKHGIWVAGALRPTASPEQIRALRASAPSGDWRPINGALELVAVCQVNVPGFPIARARVASGQVYALVAAGAQVLARMKSDPVAELAQRVAALENTTNSELSIKAAEAKARFEELRAATFGSESVEITEESIIVEPEDLKARVASANAVAELAAISSKARERLAKEGKALPDGSYPIRNLEDLKNAIHAYGRSKPADRAKVRRHIMKRAKDLGKADIIPEEWKSASIIDDSTIDDMKARVASASAVTELADISQNVRERLAKEGKALPDGSYPIRNASDLKNAIKAYGRASEADRAKVRKHIMKRARALGKADLIPENWK